MELIRLYCVLIRKEFIHSYLYYQIHLINLFIKKYIPKQQLTIPSTNIHIITNAIQEINSISYKIMSFKNKNIVRQFPFFSHFMCLPLTQQKVQQTIIKTQQTIQNKLRQRGFIVQQTLKRHSHLLTHLTLFMLTLRRQQTKDNLTQILTQQHQQIIDRLHSLQIKLTGVKYFTRANKNLKCNQLTVIYLEIDKHSQQILQQLIDYLTKILLKNEVIVPQELKSMRINYNHKIGKFQLQTFHISLFRCRGLMEKQTILQVFNEVNQQMNNNNINGNKNNNNNNNSSQQQKAVQQQSYMKISCQTLDVSTMMAFDQSQFYQPFIRLSINKQLFIRLSINKQLIKQQQLQNI